METKQITIPESWNEITIGQFQELVALNKEQLSQKEKLVEIISILTDTDSSEVKKIPGNVILDIDNQLKWLVQKPTVNFKKTFTIDRVEYGMIPSLNMLSIGEMIDLEQYSENANEDLHKFISVLYRPVVKKDSTGWYEIEEYDSTKAEGRASLFRDRIMISDVFGVSVFFSLIGIGLLNSSEDCTQEVLNLTAMEMMN